MKKVCIIIGHSAKDGGAHNANLDVNEYDYNGPLASMLAERLHKLNILPVIVFRSSYSRMIHDVNATDADFAIELHCNAVVNKAVKGSETLYWHTSKSSKAFALSLQTAVAGLFGERNRGLKAISQDGDDNRGWQFLKQTKMPAVILEPFFLSNDESLELGLTLREQLAQVLAVAMADHVKGVVIDEANH